MGATAAVGLVEGVKGISWTVMIKAIIGWVATLIIVGLMSGIFMALGIFTPNLRSLQAINRIKTDTFDAAESTIARIQEGGGCLAEGTAEFQVSPPLSLCPQQRPTRRVSVRVQVSTEC